MHTTTRTTLENVTVMIEIRHNTACIGWPYLCKMPQRDKFIEGESGLRIAKRDPAAWPSG